MCDCSQRKNQVLRVTDDGVVHSSEHYGSSTVIIEDNSPFEHLKTGYYIEVAPIHSMIVEHGSQIIAMPLGADVELKIVFQDKFGRSFAHGKVRI